MDCVGEERVTNVNVCLSAYNAWTLVEYDTYWATYYITSSVLAALLVSHSRLPYLCNFLPGIWSCTGGLTEILPNNIPPSPHWSPAFFRQNSLTEVLTMTLVPRHPYRFTSFTAPFRFKIADIRCGIIGSPICRARTIKTLELACRLWNWRSDGPGLRVSIP